jgi:hypothetical protein
MAADHYDQVVAAGNRVVDGLADRVLADRVTVAALGQGSGPAGPGPAGGPGTTGVAGGAAQPTTPPIDPPVPVLALDPWFTMDAALQSCLEKVRDLEVGGKFPYRSLQMALVDMTEPELRRPKYAGVNDRIQSQVDDIARLGLMFAAFQLRDLVRTAVSAMDLSSARGVLQDIESAWQPVWEKRFPNRKSDAPKYDRIFKVSQLGAQQWTASFTEDARRDDGILNGIAAAGSGENVDFTSRLNLMLRWNDNAAARGIQRDLGFQTTNALIEDAGFFDASRGGGLWLSKHYGINEQWGGGDPVSAKTVQGTTARAVAELLTLLAQDRLVRATTNRDIWKFMSSSRSGTLGNGDWIVNAVDAATDPDAPVVPGATPAKRTVDGWLGLTSVFGSRFGDCALVRRVSPFGFNLQYCAVVLGASSVATIEQVAVKLDDCIRAQHPKPPPPPPAPATT